MGETQEIVPVEKCDLVGMVAEFFSQGYRLVQIGCSTLPGAYELTYSFDREYRFRNLRITAVQDEEIPSISVIYPGAFLYENEIHDLFGVPIKYITVDYHGTMFRTALPQPFGIGNVKLPEPPKQKPSAGAVKPEAAKEKAGTEAEEGSHGP